MVVLEHDSELENIHVPTNGRNALWWVESLFSNDFRRFRDFALKTFSCLEPVRTKNWETNGADFTFFSLAKRELLKGTGSNAVQFHFSASAIFWGNFSRILIFSMFVEKFTLGIITTILMFSSNSTLLFNYYFSQSKNICVESKGSFELLKEREPYHSNSFSRQLAPADTNKLKICAKLLAKSLIKFLYSASPRNQWNKPYLKQTCKSCRRNEHFWFEARRKFSRSYMFYYFVAALSFLTNANFAAARLRLKNIVTSCTKFRVSPQPCTKFRVSPQNIFSRISGQRGRLRSYLQFKSKIFL